MKNTLNESKRLQKLAGILKENSDQMGFGSSEPGANIQFTSGNVIKRLDGIAKQHGFAPAITAVKPPLKAVWKSAVGSVALYQDPQSGLVVKWHGMDGSGDQEGIDMWMDPATWEQNFPMAPDDSGDELDGDEDLYEAPRRKPAAGGNVTAMVDSVIKANYPTARKISDRLTKDLYLDEGFKSLGYYIVNELPGADEYGRVEDFDREDLDEVDFVAVSVVQHIASGRIFVYQLNRFGEPEGSYGESSGEIINGKIDFEMGREADVEDASAEEPEYNYTSPSAVAYQINDYFDTESEEVTPIDWFNEHNVQYNNVLGAKAEIAQKGVKMQFKEVNGDYIFTFSKGGETYSIKWDGEAFIHNEPVWSMA
jgi:hypothetical protein